MYLNCHSYYSLRYGTLSPEQLVQAAQRFGITALALTDVNNTSAAGEFVRRCREAGIKPLLGIDFFKNGQRLYTGIARNAAGFYELNKFLSDHSIDGKPLPETSPIINHQSSIIIIYPKLIKPISQFKDHEYLGIRPEHVHGLFGSEVRHYPHKLLMFSPATFLDEEGYALHRMLRAIDCNTLITKLSPEDVAKKTELLHPPAVLEDFYKIYPKIIENTRRLVDSCEVELETGLSVNRQTFTGSREGDFKLLEKLAVEGFGRRYGGGQFLSPPAPPRRGGELHSAIFNQYSQNSSAESAISQGNGGVNSGKARQLFQSLAALSSPPLRGGVGGEKPAIQPAIQKELYLIREMDFCAYFLITWDIVRYAQAAGYHHVGRGSGANSIVAYCLGITDVDPIELDLYFERFINKNRPSPPDFDIDFSWDERDDVTDYIFKRYGREHTALLATYSTFQFNAAVREVGKVFGLPKEEIDNFAGEVLRATGTEDVRYWKYEKAKWGAGGSAPPDSPPAPPRRGGELRSAGSEKGSQNSNTVSDAFQKNSGLDNGKTGQSFQSPAALGSPPLRGGARGESNHPQHVKEEQSFKSTQPLAPSFSEGEQGGRNQKSDPSRVTKNLKSEILHFARRLHNFPNHLSIHAGGVLISEKPIFYHTALQMMPKGFPISHFDMHHAEDLGFHKFDVLSQRGLGHIKDAVDLVKMNQGKAVDIHDIPAIKRDEKVRGQLRSGHCTGCFYVESPAMRGLLKKLRCEDYRHLVAASSIIRPGVAKSGMMKEYIKRFHSPHSFEYLHPVFKEHLGETFGVMVYQEDVMKIVHHFAGLGLGESDMLRRLMSGKKRQGDQFGVLKKKYFGNCRALGHPEALANEVWRQVESFAGYSFCKAHSASYAVESFQSLYLKAYFPLEFMVAVINNFGGFYRTEYYFHEARMAGAAIHAPCVNHSQYLTTIRGTDIYAGFIHLNQMERLVAHRIVAERARGGPFRSLAGFVSRVEISSNQLDLLIRIGAFRFTGMSKCALMWEKNAVFNPKFSSGMTRASGLLFEDEHEDFELPQLEEGQYDQAFDEIELLGFPLCPPFDLVENEAAAAEGITAAGMKSCPGRMVVMVGYYVTRKDVRTVKGELMHFGTWLDRDGHFFDTVHFPNFIKNSPFRGRGVYRIEGRVVEEYGFPSVEVVKMERAAFRGDERYGG
jgi:DNA polymerase III alpha subunit